MRRGRLFRALDAGVKGPLTLLTGPPGAGKTVLLSGWLAQRRQEGTVAWLSVEAADAQPERFWRALLGAIRVGGETRFSALTRGDDRARFLAEFANAVSELDAPLLLVLDDFESIREPDVPEELDILLRHPPSGLHLVVASRVDPGLSLPRLRLEERLKELRSADLAFTREETAELFEIAGLELSEQERDTLHSRTEGWVAGLRLAALSLQQHPDRQDFVSTFAGDERPVADYLVEEVLEYQPDQVRDFMLRTSVVDLLSPELADTLTGRHDGAELLDLLERSNAFVVPIEQQRGWYRYHPLFAELLRSELRHRMPDAFALQHRRAAHWHAAEGLTSAATRHALAARDWDLAGRLVSSQWVTMLVEGQAHELGRVIRQLPRAVLAGDPELAVAGAGALLVEGQLDQAHEYLELADRGAESVPHRRRADFALSRAIASLYEARCLGEFDVAPAAARSVLGGSPSGSRSVSSEDRRALALLNLGVAEAWSGEPMLAHQHLEDALALARFKDRPYLVLSLISQIAMFEALGGALRRAAERANEGVALAEEHAWLTHPAVAPAHVALGIATYHWGKLAEAAQHLDRARAAAAQSPERTVRAVADIVSALIMSGADELGRAEGMMRAARQNAEGWKLPLTLSATLAWAEGKVLAASGKYGEALAVVEDGRELARCGELNLVRARLALAEGEPLVASEIMEPSLEGIEPTLYPCSQVDLHALAALAKHQCGEDEAALAVLEQALDLAEPEGHRQAFLEVGAPLRPLLSRRIRAGTAHRSLAGDLVDALDPRSTREPGLGALLLEPLSEREEAVLRYLPTVMSKAEIAGEMFLSVNTVKTHMKNIYRKLDVTNRAEAVRRARSLHLV